MHEIGCVRYENIREKLCVLLFLIVNLEIINEISYENNAC